jgi:hypothetical protein
MDWFDIILHCVVAVIFVTSSPLILGRYYIQCFSYLLFLGLSFWPIRELIQHWNSPADIFLHSQSLLEWLIPVIITCLGMGFVIKGIKKELEN